MTEGAGIRAALIAGGAYPTLEEVQAHIAAAYDDFQTEDRAHAWLKKTADMLGHAIGSREAALEALDAGTNEIATLRARLEDRAYD